MLTHEWLTLDSKSHLYRQSVIGFPSGVFNPAQFKPSLRALLMFVDKHGHDRQS